MATGLFVHTLSRLATRKTSKLCITGHVSGGNPPETKRPVMPWRRPEQNKKQGVSCKDFTKSSRPALYLWRSKVLVNEKIRYIRQIFSHWQRPCSVMHRKRARVGKLLVHLTTVLQGRNRSDCVCSQHHQHIKHPCFITCRILIRVSRHTVKSLI